MYMLDKAFIYKDLKNNTNLYLNGPYSANPDKLLELYIKWYNEDFAPFEKLEPIDKSNFEFCESVCPIDFYDDYKRFEND